MTCARCAQADGPAGRDMPHKSKSETELSLATDSLADYAGDDPVLLAKLLMVAMPKAYRKFFPVAERQANRALPVQGRAGQKAKYQWNDPPIEPCWTKPDAAS